MDSLPAEPQGKPNNSIDDTKYISCTYYVQGTVWSTLYVFTFFYILTIICFHYLIESVGFPGGSNGKASACSAGDPGLIPGVGKIPCRRKWQPTPVHLPGKFHGLRSLVGYSPWGRKESDTTEQLPFLSFFSLLSLWPCIRWSYIQILAVPLAGCATLGKMFNSIRLRFSHLKWEKKIVYNS